MHGDDLEVTPPFGNPETLRQGFEALNPDAELDEDRLVQPLPGCISEPNDRKASGASIPTSTANGCFLKEGILGNGQSRDSITEVIRHEGNVDLDAEQDIVDLPAGMNLHDADETVSAEDSSHEASVVPNDNPRPTQDGKGAGKQGPWAWQKQNSFNEKLDRAERSRCWKWMQRWTPKSSGSDNKRLKEILSGSPKEDPTGGNKSCHGRLTRIVRSDTFESCFALLILANTLILAIEAQYRGIDNGYTLGYPGSMASATEAWPGAKDTFTAFEWVFGVLFTVELLLKLFCLRSNFCKDYWNFIDTVIVIGWLVSTMDVGELPLDPMLMRLARLARLLRLVRLIRTIRLFDSLYLMTTAMRGSGSVLLWSVILLALVQMLLAFFLQSFLEVYILDTSKPEVARLEVFKYYGTFARTMLTMFEITLGNWMPPCRALVENVSEWYMLFSLTHKLVIGFSVVSVITSVFIQETFKVATIDDRIMMMQKERASKTHIRKIGALFLQADDNGNGEIDRGEFAEVLKDDEIKTWLTAMELDVRDPGELFDLLDVDGDGEITVKELVNGVSRLKGAAKNYDIVSLQRSSATIMEDLTNMRRRFDDLSRRLRVS